MNIELLNWLGNFVNFTILAYISLSVVSTKCFDTFQMSLSMMGLISSICVNMISVYIKYKNGELNK